jgi:VWFA-related protein
MDVSAGRHLRFSAFVLSLLVCATANPIVRVRAQSSPNTPPAAPSANAPAAATASAASGASGANAPEMSTQENPVPLQMHVNLVPVRVVVRDSEGKAVSNLHREDFQLFEDGKPQVISNFTVETLASLSQNAAHPDVAVSGAEAAPPPAFALPSRFVALVFDDPRLTLQDLMLARNAASRFVQSSLAPVDRVAVFTVSGQTQSDFTDDRAKLQSILDELQPRDVTAGEPNANNDCPPMDYYEADQIQNKHDSQTIEVATEDAMACLTQEPSTTMTAAQIAALAQQAQSVVAGEALRLEEFGDEQTAYSLRRIREIIERMSALPGQRWVVFISPGFIYPNRESEFSEILDRAIRENVFINTLDARGLYTPDLGDISQPTIDANPVTKGFRTRLHLEGEASQLQVLVDLANGTGGFAFHDNNDLEAGLRELASAPEAYYLLAFVPQNLKFDGHFHSIKVSMAGKEKFAIQARKGFYAPQHGETPAEAAARDIQDAVFSQEEQHGLPVALQTQYYKTDASDAKLSVLARVDLAHVHFDKADGRNQNDLTVVAALFDRNGNFITGTQKVISMKLLDETLAKLAQTGVTIRTSFDVKPGDYVVRLVVRDSKAELVSAENGAVEIPY